MQLVVRRTAVAGCVLKSASVRDKPATPAAICKKPQAARSISLSQVRSPRLGWILAGFAAMPLQDCIEMSN
jgi:hypothetical protein